jgi:hypothetical protein
MNLFILIVFTAALIVAVPVSVTIIDDLIQEIKDVFRGEKE